MSCFCANIDYPAVGAWAVCDQHHNDLAARRTSRPQMPADTLAEELVDALRSFAVELRRSNRSPRHRPTHSPTPPPAADRMDDLRKKTAW